MYQQIRLEWEGKRDKEDGLFSILYTDQNYTQTFKLDLKEGSFLQTNEFSKNNGQVVINEKAEEILGFKDPVGKTLTSGDGLKLRITGVVKDFHFKSLHAKIEPLIILPNMPEFIGGTCYIRMKPGHLKPTVDYIKKIFKSHNLAYPLDFRLLDDEYSNLYRTEQRIQKIFGWSSFLAILISCLGLIGLSSFMTERRTKEIGIRKTNGAKSNELFLLLSKEYIVLGLVSVVIASPVAWYAMHKWLQNFGYRINISLWVFVLVTLVVLIITLLTVGFQSYRAASKNPVEALRYE
jgi:putative ABC transport system permease protein